MRMLCFLYLDKRGAGLLQFLQVYVRKHTLRLLSINISLMIQISHLYIQRETPIPITNIPIINTA